MLLAWLAESPLSPLPQFGMRGATEVDTRRTVGVGGNNAGRMNAAVGADGLDSRALPGFAPFLTMWRGAIDLAPVFSIPLVPSGRTDDGGGLSLGHFGTGGMWFERD